MPYRFTPPTKKYPVGQDSDALWGRITNDVGMAVVVYTDGRVITTSSAPSTSDDGVSLVWPGGRTYTISDGEAALLTEAGYSANLEEIV